MGCCAWAGVFRMVTTSSTTPGGGYVSPRPPLSSSPTMRLLPKLHLKTLTMSSDLLHRASPRPVSTMLRPSPSATCRGASPSPTSASERGASTAPERGAGPLSLPLDQKFTENLPFLKAEKVLSLDCPTNVIPGLAVRGVYSSTTLHVPETSPRLSDHRESGATGFPQPGLTGPECGGRAWVVSLLRQPLCPKERYDQSLSRRAYGGQGREPRVD
jgi:hypothetical protein